MVFKPTVENSYKILLLVLIFVGTIMVEYVKSR